MPEDAILHRHRCENLKAYNCYYLTTVNMAVVTIPSGYFGQLLWTIYANVNNLAEWSTKLYES
jgi:hypothetical protein